ncbi:MAG: multicopper oxidase domain-containing protein [Pyrinomonadaceae bacterium]
MHTIDHKKFDGEVGEVVLLNNVEEWKIINESYPSTAVVSHPFHIHINPFQVTDIFDPNQNVTVTIPDPKNRRLTTTVTVPRYVFDRNDLDKRPAVAAKQCLLDPFAERDTWKPCGPAFVNKDNIWWDVFPIPSGRNVTTSKDEIDPTTKQPVIDSTTNKPKKVVVNVPGWFKMRSRFVDFPGFYVLHCHILAHEDRGMMTIVEVAPARTPYSHN